MDSAASASLPAPSGLLRFACVHCRKELEVPAALAGVSGPCPCCGGQITAPQANVVAGSAAALFAKPPPSRDLPPPMPPVEALPLSPPSGPPAPVPVRKLVATAPAPSSGPRRESNAVLVEQHGRGIFDSSAAPAAHQLNTGRPPATLRRTGWRRWMDLGIVSVFTGLTIATVAALRYTQPVENTAVAGLPANMNEVVEAETRRLEMNRTEAVELAQASVRGYLASASEQAAATHLLPPPEGMSPPPFPPFAGTLPGAYDVKSARRIAGTDRFLVTVQPKEQPGPVFVVEQTENGPRLQAGPITQQSAGLFQKFLAGIGQGEATLYTEVRPTLKESDGERSFRTRFPGLSEFQLIDVRPAFPESGPPQVFIACLPPGSEAGKVFAKRAHDPSWRPSLIRFRWERAPVGGPYAEVVSFIPGSWSGDRLLPASPPNNTARLTP